MHRLLLALSFAGLLAAQPRQITLTKEVPGGVVIFGTAATPTFLPTAGAVDNPTTVNISTATTACSSYIYWKTSAGVTSGDNHSGSFTATGAGTWYAKVIGCPFYNDSAEASAAYTIPPSCTTPTGTVLTESFGDASASCWSSGPSTCNNTWTVAAGTGQSLISSPGTPSSNTACTNSLQLNATPGDYIYHGVTMIPYATTVDLDMWIYPVAYTDSAAMPILSFSRDIALNSSNRAIVVVTRNGGAYGLQAYSDAGVSSTISITVNAWHAVHLHLEDGTSLSSVSVDGGTAATFTHYTSNTNYLVLGGASAAATTVFGALRVN